MRVTVIGAGVAGLVCALELAERGAEVAILERAPSLGAGACSWFAGGMLAPWCERESAEAAVTELGREALAWWPRRFAGTVQRGALVVAPARDAGELTRFARRTERHERLDEAGLAALEPDLAGRFRQGLFFPEEAHLDPRLALRALAQTLAGRGVSISFGVEADADAIEEEAIVDCRGFAARGAIEDLRGVRGEMVILRTRDITLSRPVRLLHPRIPLYVVPRADGLFMIGATMIESDHRGPATARSVVELINGAYALHPAFGEAEIMEIGAEVRPAFSDNLPRIVRRGRVTSINGLYRHGFLLSPAMARQAAQALLSVSESGISEARHDDHRERRSA